MKLAYSIEWDERYKENNQMSIWPWSDLVSYVMRYAKPRNKNCRVLELGCGSGANIPFFLDLGVEYYGIEESGAIVKRNIKRFPQLKKRILIGDFTRSIPFPEKFDLVVDRSSLTHNSAADIKNCLKLVFHKLKSGGVYIGIDWFSTSHSDYKKGSAADDRYTRTDFEDGQFAYLGKVHFSDKKHLLEFFSCFNVAILEHKIIRRHIPEGDHIFAAWNIIAKKE